MTTFRKSFTTLLILILPLLTLADPFDDIVSAMRLGSAKDVARFFNGNVELTVQNNEGVYSRQQAEIILKSFFAQSPPKSVQLQHKGTSAQGAQYAIAIYESAQARYRAYIFLKDSGNGMLIHELRFEKE